MLVRKAVHDLLHGYELVIYENSSTKKMEGSLHLKLGSRVTTIAYIEGDTEDEVRREIAIHLHLLAERVFAGRA